MPNSNSNTFLCGTKASVKMSARHNVDQSGADIVSHFIFLLCCQIKRTFRGIESIPFLRLMPSHSDINVTVRKRNNVLEYMFVGKNQACKSWICVCHVCHVPWFVFVKVEYVFAKCRAMCSVCHVPCAMCCGAWL